MNCYPISSALPAEAFALRPMRIGRDDVPVHFTASSFKRGLSDLQLFVRRMECFGMIEAQPESMIGERFVDVLAENGDILLTLAVNRKGFEYMRAKLQARREQLA